MSNPEAHGRKLSRAELPAAVTHRPAGYSAGALDWAFDAARSSGYRGMFFFPELDPAHQMTQITRTVAAQKINWCYNNIGAVRLVIDGLALDEVDTGLWPKPMTISPAFNAAVKTAWQQQCGFHKSFSTDGENNFYSAQMMVRREIRLRGDCFGQKLRAGEAAACPQMHFLPSYQCDNASTRLDQSQWTDGRRDSRLGRALQWRFLTNRERTAWTDQSADDVVHFHDPFLIGQKRGMSALAPVVRKLFSMDDIERTKSSGVLLRTRIAYAIERSGGDDDGAPTLLPGAAEIEEVPQPDGTKLIIQKVVAQNGDEVEVADLPPNKRLKVIESAKSDEAGAWIKELLADVAYCTLYPPDYIFALAGMGQGTLVRMTQGRVQRVVNTVRDFQIILQGLEEWWPFWLWQNILRGTFDNVRGGVPTEWWPYLVVRPKDLTVDMGREGRLYDDRLNTGKMPAGLYVGMLYGEDEEQFEDAIIRDAYRRRARNAAIAAELKVPELPIAEIFRPPAGTAAAMTAATEEEVPADDAPGNTRRGSAQ